MKKLRIVSWVIIGFFSFITIASIMLGKAPKEKSDIKTTTNNNKPQQQHGTVEVEKVENNLVAAPAPDTTITQETTETEITTEQTVVEEETTQPPTITTNNIKCVWGDFEITEEEYELICTTVFCESGNKSLQTQVLVCLTILNRYAAGYADSIKGVVYAKNAYTVTDWKDFENRGWTVQVEQAVNIALTINDHPRNMFYFRDNYFHPGSWAKDYIASDNMYFSTSK